MRFSAHPSGLYRESRSAPGGPDAAGPLVVHERVDHCLASCRGIEERNLPALDRSTLFVRLWDVKHIPILKHLIDAHEQARVPKLAYRV